MRTRLRDVAWLLVAAVALAWVTASFVLGIRKLFGRPDPLAILGFGMLGVVGFWLVAGAWLRTSWGQAYLERRRSIPTSSVRGNGSQR